MNDFLDRDHGTTFQVKYVKVNELLPNKVNDVTPPVINLLTPTADGSTVAEDDQGRILVSGRVTDESGVAWINRQH